MNEDPRPVALVTGGSRGVGAATVLALASRGFDVLLTYRNKAARAEEIAARAREAGADTVACGADLTQETDIAELARSLKDWRERLDLLVLNASGGLERDLVTADPEYPMRINRDAQLRLVDVLLPLMPPGSTIVFVTSHWAHLYGRTSQLPAYEPVARTKWAGEQALRERIPELSSRGIRLLVVTGDLVEGTITPRLLERAGPGMTAARQAAAGGLPTTEDMGAAIADAATNTDHRTGCTTVVGGNLETLL